MNYFSYNEHKMFFSIIIIFVSLLFCNETKSQTAIKKIITDRPDQAESAETILKGFFQIETGFLYNKNTSDLTQEIKFFDIAGTLVRIGLAKDIELRIGSSLLSQETSSLLNSNTISGINGLNIGAKIRLINETNSTPNISAIVNFKLPVGEQTFRPQNIEPEFVLISAKELSDIVTLSVNIGSGWNSTDEVLNYFYSLSFGISLSDKVGTYLEYYGNSSSNISAVNKFDTGFTYLLKNNFQLDISGGLNLNNGISDWFAGTGLSFRLPN